MSTSREARPTVPEDRAVYDALRDSVDPAVLRSAVRTQQDLREQGRVVGLFEVLAGSGEVEDSILRQLQSLIGAPPTSRTRREGGTSSGFERGSGTPGETFGRYRLIEELGRGGMGVVWKAHDVQLDRVVALKRILAREFSCGEPRERFLREARAAARLRHPHVVTVFDIGEVDGQPYATTEFIEGETLENRTRRGIPPREAVRLLAPIAEALQAAHDAGIVHRDVKPSNILVDRSGKPYVMDFGLAKDVLGAREGTLTPDGIAVGTPRYMSPEQVRARGGIGPATDQFSLGVVLYEILTGQHPFPGEGIAGVLESILTREPVPPGSLAGTIDRRLEATCLRMLQKDPGLRYPSMGDVAAELRRSTPGGPSPPGSRRALRAVAASIGAALLLTIGIGIARRRDEPEHSPPPPDPAAELLARPRADLEAALLELRRPQGDLDRFGRLADDAIAGARRAADALPDSPEARRLLGRAASLRGDHRDAESAFRAAIRLDPADARSRLDLARTRLVEAFLGRSEAVNASYADAGVAALLELIGDRADLSPADRALADAMRLQALDRPADALRAVESSLAELGPEPGVEDLLWLRSLLLEPVEERLASLDRALELAPNHALALHSRGVLRFGRGDLDRAIADYTLALRIHPRLPAALNNRGACWFARRDFDRALADLDAAVALDPGAAVRHANRGTILLERGDAAAALRDFDAALERDPGLDGARLQRGKLRLLGGQLDAALEDYDALLARQPGWAAAWSDRAAVWIAKGDSARALDDFANALRLDPQMAGTYFNRGTLHHTLGDHDLALIDLDTAIRLDPGNAPARRQRANTRFVKGDLEGALADLDEALRIQPTFVEALHERGCVRYHLGRTAAGIADVERALDLARPDWVQRPQALDDLERMRRSDR